MGVEGKTASEIFGYPDDLKFHSSMTLFAKAAEANEADEVFGRRWRSILMGRWMGGLWSGFRE